MTNRPARLTPALAGAAALASAWFWAAAPALSAPGGGEPAYPFDGTWVRADRACSPASPHARTYTARDVATATGRCQIRKVATGSGQWELFEECRKPERPGNLTETIRMLGPDALLLKIQTSRLKIARGRRYTRCAVAAPSARPTPLAKPPPKPDDDRPGKAPKPDVDDHPAKP